MGSLRSAVDELASEVLSSVTDDRLSGDVVELRRSLDAGESEWMRRVAELDRRKAYRRDGAVSVNSFLAAACGMSGRNAEGAVRLGHLLPNRPNGGGRSR